MTDNFKITAHMVTSLDGFAAKKDNSVSWFNTADHYAKGVDAPDVEAFLKTIDCYIMGAHTYEHAIALAATYGWPYGEIPTIVVSNRNLPVNKPNIQLYSGNLDTLIHEQVRPKYNNVWVVGGPMLIKDCIRLKLVHEIRVTILPIILGDGKLFFDFIGQEQALHLKDVTAYKNGLVELCYEIKL